MTDQARNENKNRNEAQEKEYPNLPYALTLFCQVEYRTMLFGRKYRTLYECPCGEFQWDIRSENLENAGRVVKHT